MDYAYRVEWSPEDNEFVGLVAEFPSRSWLAPTSAEAMQGIVGVIEQVVADMADARKRRAAIDPLSGSPAGEDVPMSVLFAADTGHDVDFEPERLGLTARTPDL
jgi:predicted RNase H-like HicB family nuclease